MLGRNTTYLLLGLYFFCYTIPQSIFNFFFVYDRVSIHFLFLAVINLISFLLVLRKNTIDEFLSVFKEKPHSFSYLLFIVFGLISILSAENKVESIVSITQLLIFFSSFVIIVFLSKLKHINFIKAFTVFTLMAVFIESVYINYLFYDSIVISGNILDRSNEFRGFTANINISSFSLCLKIPLLFYLTFNTKVNALKLLSLIMIFSSITTILLLGGRGSIIALLFILIMIFIICILNINKLKIINLSLSILIVVLSLSAYQYFNQNNTSSRVVERFSNVLNPNADQSVKERLNFYSAAFQSIRGKPLLGVGIGNWKLISIKYNKDVIDDYKVPYHVHNDFLQVAAEIGLIGGIAYMYFIFFPFLMSIKKFLVDKEKNLNKYALVFLIFGVYIIDSLLNFPMARPVSFIYLLFAMALFYISYPNNLNDEK
jgi:O-antigen ligase